MRSSPSLDRGHGWGAKPELSCQTAQEVKVTEAAKPDFLFMPRPLLRAPVLVRLGLQSWTESWPGRREEVLSLHWPQGTDSNKSKTGNSRKTGNRNKNRKLFWSLEEELCWWGRTDWSFHGCKMVQSCLLDTGMMSCQQSLDAGNSRKSPRYA